MREQAVRSSLRGKLASLPKPKETEWELELPEEQDETASSTQQMSAEDAAIRDKRNAERAHAAALADFKLQTQVVQKGLPRPQVVDVEAMLRNADAMEDLTQKSIAIETAMLMGNDALNFGGGRVNGVVQPVQMLKDEALQKAKMEVILEMGQDCLLYTSPSPRDGLLSRMPSSA